VPTTMLCGHDVHCSHDRHKSHVRLVMIKRLRMTVSHDAHLVVEISFPSKLHGLFHAAGLHVCNCNQFLKWKLERTKTLMWCCDIVIGLIRIDYRQTKGE
jgi:hypothetical protein